MNKLFPVKVECYSGYRSDEYPACFYLNNFCFEIREIIDQWYQGDLNPDYPPANYFKVKTNDKKIYILKHDEHSDKWFLWIHGESMNL